MNDIIYSDKHFKTCGFNHQLTDNLNYHGRVYRLLHFKEYTNNWEKEFLKTIYVNNYSSSNQWTIARRIEKRIDGQLQVKERIKEINDNI